MEKASNQNALYQDYLIDLSFLLKEMAIEAKKASDKEKTDFSVGYLSGFHRVISLMQQQAESFGIPLDILGLDGIDPNLDLV
ncbi:hypothetical protein [Desulfofustis glycolicus]|uniref:Uncharacterized protein n=1 Tax=Desulfofustis glycolicus DSM 9705 TaxID=1121409 RepID=A0A1M5YVR6_9BACT|nr:hypothetical protein [Desulfofustis glycolicus]MCB2218092.1 hypothetical protein [Desulfobulbaceae bacterium]SHI16101.1 hypothetical protein SAMN02745124_04499 [Desulfofustis glycolicus DSM 9705]